MTTTLVALWTAPSDLDAFTADYLATHVALCEALPGIAEVKTGAAMPGGPYVRMTTLEFPDMATFGAAMGTPAGAAVIADGGRLNEAFANKTDTLILE